MSEQIGISKISGWLVAFAVIGALGVFALLYRSTNEGPPAQEATRSSQPSSREDDGLDPRKHHQQPKKTHPGAPMNTDTLAPIAEALADGVRTEEVLSAAFLAQLEMIQSLEAPYFRRLEAVGSLGGELSSAEIDALYRFLLSPPPEAEGERNRDRALRNNILNTLRAQVEKPAGLTAVMIRMFEDKEQDEVVRDYAIQHLGAWFLRAPLEERPEILAAITEALEETQGGTPGTALLSLHSISEDTGEIEGDAVATAARKIAYSQEVETLSRITALQVLAARDPLASHSAATEWALDSQASYPQRISAIAALGASGTPDAMATLSLIHAEQDELLEPALKRAIHRLENTGVAAP